MNLGKQVNQLESNMMEFVITFMGSCDIYLLIYEIQLIAFEKPSVAMKNALKIPWVDNLQDHLE